MIGHEPRNGGRATRSSTVRRDRGHITIRAAFDWTALSLFISAVDDALHAGYDNLILDFQATTKAWPEAMVPVVATADWLRHNGGSIGVVLPEYEELRRLFLNTGWAHFFGAS
jgi:hypothetical protein